MKNKKITIILIILLSICAVLLTGTLIFLLDENKGLKEFTSKQEVYKREFENKEESINISAASYDVTIKNSLDDKIHVEVYTKDKEKIKMSDDKNELNITANSSFCIGFCFDEERIIVSVPSDYNQKINLDVTSADVQIETSNALDIKFKSSSGDVDIKCAKSVEGTLSSGDFSGGNIEKAKVSTSSGDIEIDNVSSYINLKSNSGDIELTNVSLNQNSSIVTSSGEVSIEYINGVYVSTQTSSGTVRVDNNDRFGKSELKIKTSSGDIYVK